MLGKILASIFLISCIGLSQTTFYIDTTGSDSNNGTSPSTPWKTLARLDSALQITGTRARTWYPGDSVLFKYGQKWEPTSSRSVNAIIDIPYTKNLSGTVAQPIVWGAYGDSMLGRPILCCKNLGGGGSTTKKLIYCGYFKNWKLENLELHGYIDAHNGSYTELIDGWTWYNLYLNGLDGEGTWMRWTDAQTHYIAQWAELYEDSTYPNIYHFGKAQNIHISHCQFEYLPKGLNAQSIYKNFYFGYNTARNVDHFLTIGSGTSVTFEYNWDISPTGSSGIKIENQRCKLDSVTMRGNLFYCADGAGNVLQSVGVGHFQMYNNTLIASNTSSSWTQFSLGWQGEGTVLSGYPRYAMYSGAGTVVPYSGSLIQNNILMTRIVFSTLTNHYTVSQRGFTWTQTWSIDSMFAHGMNWQRNALYNRADPTQVVTNWVVENKREIWYYTTPGDSSTGYFTYNEPTSNPYPVTQYYVYPVTSSNITSRWNAVNSYFPSKPQLSDTSAQPAFVNLGSTDTSGYRLQYGWAVGYGQAIPTGLFKTYGMTDSTYSHDLSGYPIPSTDGYISIGAFQYHTDPPPSPSAVTNAATLITSTSGLMNGTVNPNGNASTAWFEWSPYISFSVSDSVGTQSIGSGSTNLPISAPLTSLQPSTTYYFRVVAQSVGGTTRGTAAALTTTSAPAGNSNKVLMKGN